MPTPSYARGTAASILKTKHGGSSDKDLAGPIDKLSSSPSTPKVLQRPSTLTPKKRQSIAYNATLFTIKPRDRKKPCPFAELPSEIRLEIWTYLLDLSASYSHPRRKPNPRKNVMRFYWPEILHVCRAMRIEAAYIYYTTCPFVFHVWNMNFCHVTHWLRSLPAQHRELLKKNRNMRIDINPGLKHTYTYPPKDFVLDDYTRNHWETCRPYGNLHLIPSGCQRQKEFIVFCRMLAWFQFLSSYPYRDIQWHYEFHARADPYHPASGLKSWSLTCFVQGEINILCKNWSKDWTRGRGTGKGVVQANEFLRQLEEGFKCVAQEMNFVKSSFWESWSEEWATEKRRVRSAISRW